MWVSGVNCLAETISQLTTNVAPTLQSHPVLQALGRFCPFRISQLCQFRMSAFTIHFTVVVGLFYWLLEFNTWWLPCTGNFCRNIKCISHAIMIIFFYVWKTCEGAFLLMPWNCKCEFMWHHVKLVTWKIKSGKKIKWKQICN